MTKIEKRFLTSELRAEEANGKIFLVGRAASYNVVSHDLGGFRERLVPGCFDGVLASRDLDCLHTVEHDRNRILGRTTSGTLKLRSDAKGLHYRTELPDTGYADDVAALCKRGDLNSSSFAFTVDPDGEKWDDNAEGPDGTRCILRTINRIASLHDVATVASPAYPETAAGLSRSLPASMPIELRNRILLRAAGNGEGDGECDCTCEECKSGDCVNCSNEDCVDADCAGCPMQEDTRGNRGGDPAKQLLQLAEDYFKSSDVSDADKATAWAKLEALAGEAGIDEDDERAARDREVTLAIAEAAW